MKQVSRSFSLVAPEVDSPLDDYLAAAYLICRVVDNIEDTEQPFPWRQHRFTEFALLLNDPAVAQDVLSGWDSLQWPGLTASEIEMMTSENGLILWQIYAHIPGKFREPIRHWATVMANGMQRSSDPGRSDFFTTHGAVRLPKLATDYDLYCFYVAGTVGRMITDLAIHFYDVQGQRAQTLREGSDACGRALQKTNIVKDFAHDLARGVSYLPAEWMQDIDFAPLRLRGVPDDWKTKVLLNVVAELEDSVAYVLALPDTAVGYRKAGLLMMLPAYETILLAAQKLPDLFTPAHAVKISRTKMGQCLLRARKIATDDEAITAYAQEMSHEIRSELGLLHAQAR